MSGEHTCLFKLGEVEKLELHCSQINSVGTGWDLFWCARSASFVGNFLLQCPISHSTSTNRPGVSESELDALSFLGFPCDEELPGSWLSKSATLTRLNFGGTPLSSRRSLEPRRPDRLSDWSLRLSRCDIRSSVWSKAERKWALWSVRVLWDRRQTGCSICAFLSACGIEAPSPLSWAFSSSSYRHTVFEILALHQPR